MNDALAAAEAALADGEIFRAWEIAAEALCALGADYLVLLALQPQWSVRGGAQMLVRALQAAHAGRPEGSRPLLLDVSHQTTEREALLVVGGIGRMSGLYKAVCGAAGYECEYVEGRRGLGHAVRGRYSAVVVFTNTVGHPVREAAAAVAERLLVPIYYARVCSATTLRRICSDARAR